MPIVITRSGEPVSATQGSENLWEAIIRATVRMHPELLNPRKQTSAPKASEAEPE